MHDNHFSIEMLELEKIYRQQDTKFVDILNAIRNKTVEERHINILNRRIGELPNIIPLGTIVLTTKNIIADEINTNTLRNIPGKIVIFKATTQGNFKPSDYPTDESLQLKV